MGPRVSVTHTLRGHYSWHFGAWHRRERSSGLGRGVSVAQLQRLGSKFTEACPTSNTVTTVVVAVFSPTTTDKHTTNNMKPSPILQVLRYRNLRLTTKDVGKGYYKGTRTGSMGRHTKYGGYVIEWHKVRTYVCPSLDGFKVSSLTMLL